VIVGDFNRQVIQTKKSKESSELNNTVDQMDLMDKSISSSNSTLYIFLSSPWNFSKIDHVLGHKTSLNKYKKLEITPPHTVDHKGIKL
jgi:endonuclease/exonuclease/phosphatase family metal-dependent hydrolase